MSEFTHINKEGQASMVDVGNKPTTKRIAKARAIVILPADIISQLTNNDIQTKKGAVFATAVIAGIMAAKKTGEIIPLCHSLNLEDCQVDIQFNDHNELYIDCTASITAKTGVEMEALVGASVAALTVYDMCKAMSHDVVIKEIKLISKTGGKNDYIRE